MLAKYDTNYLPSTKTCAPYFFTLREFTVISLGKRLVISVSQCQGVNGSSN